MKQSSSNLTFLTLLSIVLLVGCKKEVFESGNSGENINSNNAALTTSGTSARMANTIDLTVPEARIENYKLNFKIINLGNTTSPPCKVQIEYYCDGPNKIVIVKVPSLPASGPIQAGQYLSAPIEAGCFESDINFRVTVDYDNIISESNEQNNIYNGIKIN